MNKDKIKIRCQKCNTERVVWFVARCKDQFFASINKDGWVEYEGYVPEGVFQGNNNDSDYVGLKICLNCGQVQGSFPHTTIDCIENATQKFQVVI